MKHRKLIPKELVDGTLLEWRHEDIYVPPQKDFSGCHVKMEVPYFKPRPRHMFKSQRGFRMWTTKYAGKRTGWWHTIQKKNFIEARLRLEINRKCYFNSMLLATRHFKDDPSIVYAYGYYRLSKLVDHKDDYEVEGFNIKIDSLDNLRLATHGENLINSSFRAGWSHRGENSSSEKYIAQHNYKGKFMGFSIKIYPTKKSKYFSILDYKTKEETLEAAKAFRDKLPFSEFHKIKE